MSAKCDSVTPSLCEFTLLRAAYAAKNKNNAILNSVEVKVEVGVELGKKG